MRQPLAFRPPADRSPALALRLETMALDAQAALAPLALGAFALSLCPFVWLGVRASNAGWMSVGFILCATAWGGVLALAQSRATGPLPLRRRQAGHLTAGLLWAAAIGQMSVFALQAGAYRTPLLAAGVASALICIVFAAVWRPSLLIVGPAAAAGPFAGLVANARTAALAWGALALGAALGLAVERMMRRQILAAVERERQFLELSAQAQAAAAPMRPLAALLASERLSMPSPVVARLIAEAVGAEHAANDRSVA